MKEIKFFRTHSYGGVDGNLLEIRDFETDVLAKEDSLNDNFNTNFHLYEVTMSFNGRITHKQKSLGRIVCGRDLKNFETREKSKKI